MVNFYGKEVSSSADWTLQTCCDAREYIFIALYFVYGLLIHCLFHRGSIMKPFKLLGVFFHEWSHASATWITCGKVKKIEGAYVRVDASFVHRRDLLSDRNLNLSAVVWKQSMIMKEE